MYFVADHSKEKPYIIEYKGEKIYKWYPITKNGKTKLKLTFISSNGIEEQCIVFILDSNNYKITANGMEARKQKRKFPMLDFREKVWGREINVEIELSDGDIGICNGTYQLIGDKYYVNYYDACNAMKQEYLAPNKIRFYCNDYHEDEDFDDLVFDLEIIE